ncbi:hypothetical protein [Nostoc favosum]|uniref:Uncharacterized protein n=1 Tax=Nostoc favosum CHAB5714 TaxID=2780399 RepID=A0ABS8IDF7_9NOSO|nr:hypothetical protein [Nostoc favosum]MCC5601876.1 hypothetical protein [Nostoc favosum CHAB5714]
MILRNIDTSPQARGSEQGIKVFDGVGDIFDESDILITARIIGMNRPNAP